MEGSDHKGSAEIKFHPYIMDRKEGFSLTPRTRQSYPPDTKQQFISVLSQCSHWLMYSSIPPLVL
jgi:hypothetical protein